MYDNLNDIVKIQENITRDQDALGNLLPMRLGEMPNFNDLVEQEMHSIHNFPEPGPSIMDNIPSEMYHDTGPDKVYSYETQNSSMEYAKDKVIDNVQNSPNNPGLSTIQSEIYPNEISTSKTQNSSMEHANDKVFDNIENFPDNLGPSTIQSEIYHNEVSEQVSKSITQNFFMDYANVKVFDNIQKFLDYPGSSIIQSEINSNEISDQISKSKTQNSSMEHANDKVFDNIQNPRDNHGPSNVKIQSEIRSNTDSESKTQNSSMEYSSDEVIDVPSDSDDSKDYSDVHDIAIIDTVRAVVKNIITLSPPSQPADGSLAEPLKSRLNLESVAGCSHSQATSVICKTQDGSNAKVERNNDDVTYTKTVSAVRMSESSKPGCSKDSDSTSPKEDGFSNLDELLKDARLIHALLPRFSNRLIYRRLLGNQHAKNRLELTLWDLLPVQRPLPQFVRKRKSLDDVCFVECNGPNVSTQKGQADTKTTAEKKTQTVIGTVFGVDEFQKVVEETAVQEKDPIDEMKKSTPEEAALNDTNNYTNQQSATPVKKTKLDDTLVQCIQRGKNINKMLRGIVKDTKNSVSSEAGSNTKELQSTEIVKVKKNLISPPKIVSLLTMQAMSDTSSVAPVLQPAKLTLETNYMQSAQKIEMCHKPPVSILSPPKLQFLTRKTNTTIMPNTSIAANVDSNPSTSDLVPLTLRLPSTSSLNKEASYIDGHLYQPLTREITPKPPKVYNNIQAFPVPKKMEMEEALSEECTTRNLKVLQAFYNQPSGSVQALDPTFNRKTQNVPDDQKPSGSKAWFDKKQQSPVTGNFGNLLNIQENIAKDAKVIKTNLERLPDTEINVDPNKITLNEIANEIYIKLIPMFPSVKTRYVKQLCYDNVKNVEQSDKTALMEHLVDVLLNCDQENLKKLKPLPIKEKSNNPSYDINEQYADLITIFPEADPVYLRKTAEEIHGDQERYNEFVQLKLENPDYPTRAEYLAKKRITEQQKQYTTDFNVQEFLKIFPDPFLHFENDKRNCEFNPHAVDFLKFYFNKLRVNTVVKTYSNYKNNLSLTARFLETLNSDMKTRRQCNKTLTVLSEDIPFLQECAFIQHKAELRKYLDEVKANEDQEFNELKARNELFECQCCFDNECMPSKCSTCEEGHVFCNTCIIRNTDVVLGNGQTRVDCMLNCGCEFPISVLQRVLPPTTFSILLCKRQEAEVIAAGVEGLVSCPFCHFASIPPPEDKIFKCLNPECMKESCRFCKELNHVPLKCNEKKSESARLYLEERMTEALVRKCYRCSRTFFKEEGCNKMTCLCGAQMCYICDKPVTGYYHFQGQGAEKSNLCPLWSDDRRLNAESVIKVCQETMKHIKEKDPQVDINVKALLPKLPPKSHGPHDDIVHNAVLHGRIARNFQF